MEAVCI